MFIWKIWSFYKILKFALELTANYKIGSLPQELRVPLCLKIAAIYVYIFNDVFLSKIYMTVIRKKDHQQEKQS